MNNFSPIMVHITIYCENVEEMHTSFSKYSLTSFICHISIQIQSKFYMYESIIVCLYFFKHVYIKFRLLGLFQGNSTTLIHL